MTNMAKTGNLSYWVNTASPSPECTPLAGDKTVEIVENRVAQWREHSFLDITWQLPQIGWVGLG